MASKAQNRRLFFGLLNGVGFELQTPNKRDVNALLFNQSNPEAWGGNLAAALLMDCNDI
jgi:hypothetical protein